MAYTGPIDINRGVMICSHRQSGMDVFMYLDTPGVYFDAHLGPIPASFAQAAGFPTETLEKKRQLGAEMARVKSVMEETLQISSTKEVYMEKGGYRVIHFPDNGMAQIESPQGLLTKVPIALGVATVIFNELTKDLNETEEGASPSAAAGSNTSPEPAPSSPLPPTVPDPLPSPAPVAATKGKAAMKLG